MDSAAVISRAPGAVFRELSAGEGAVVLNLETGQYHGVNGVGVLIWDLLESGCTLSELVGGVRERVVDAPDGLEDDVAAFVAAMQQRGLVIVEPEGGQGTT
jgi:coenzyme PQQ synthesis protein D (PqqD)